MGSDTLPASTDVADMLSEYYGLGKIAGSEPPPQLHQEVTQEEEVIHEEVTLKARDPQTVWTEMLSTMSLNQLLQEATKASNAERSAERELQMLLYDNYRNLFTAMSGLTIMQEEAEKVERKVIEAATAMTQVAKAQQVIDPSIRPALQTLQLASRRQKTCVQLSQLASLPRKVQLLLASGDYYTALETVLSVEDLFPLRNESATLANFIDVVEKLGTDAANGLKGDIERNSFSLDIVSVELQRSLEALQPTKDFPTDPRALLFEINWPRRLVASDTLHDRLILLARTKFQGCPTLAETVKAITEGFSAAFRSVLEQVYANKPASSPAWVALFIFTAVCATGTSDVENVKTTVEAVYGAQPDALSHLTDTIYFGIKDYIWKFMSRSQILPLRNVFVFVHQTLEHSNSTLAEDVANLIGACLLETRMTEAVEGPVNDLRLIASDEAPLTMRRSVCDRMLKAVTEGLQSCANAVVGLNTSKSHINDIVNLAFVISSVVPLILSVQSRSFYEGVSASQLVKSRGVTERIVDLIETKSIVLSQLALECILRILQNATDKIEVDVAPDTFAYCLLSLSDFCLTSMLRSEKVLASQYQVVWNPSGSAAILQDSFGRLQDHLIQTTGSRLAAGLISCLSPEVLAVYVTGGDLLSPPSLGPCQRLFATLIADLEVTLDGPPVDVWELLSDLLDQDEVKWETIRLATALSTQSADLETWGRHSGKRTWQNRMIFAIMLSGWTSFTEEVVKMTDWSSETLYVLIAGCLFLSMSMIESMEDANPKRARFVMERILGFVMQMTEAGSLILGCQWGTWLREKKGLLKRTVQKWRSN